MSAIQSFKVLGLGLVCGIFIWIGVELGSWRFTDIYATLTGARAPNPPLDDFAVFYIAGSLVREGRGGSLYDLDVVRTEESKLYQRGPSDFEVLPFFNPPAFAAAMAPLSALSFELAAGVFVGLGLGVFAFAALVLWRCSSLGMPEKATILLGVLSSQAFLDTIFHGQITFFVLAAIVVAFAALTSGRWFGAGLALSVTIIKPNLLVVPGILFVWQKQWRIVLGLMSGVCLWLVVSLAVAGPKGLLAYVNLLREAATWDDRTGVGVYWMYGWNALARQLVGPDKHWVVTLIAGLLTALTVVLCALAFRSRSPTDPSHWTAQFAALIPGTILSSPHAYRQEVLLLIIPAMLLPSATHGRTRRIVWILLAGLWIAVASQFPMLDTLRVNLAIPLMAALLLVAALSASQASRASAARESAAHLFASGGAPTAAGIEPRLLAPTTPRSGPPHA
ncbi:MAG TPA: glycosyltransferase family 87 protein [Dehalococcoidia bacterium]|nr:glycosyltransferase family 87 protein [Dehalococcoidia bacterium]